MISLNKDRFEIPVWKHLKVYRDIHIQFDKSYYSIPYEYRGDHVWARKTASQLTVFIENKLIAAHITASYAGQRITNENHYPPDKYLFMLQDSDYCLSQSKIIGNYTYSFVNKILNEEPIYNLRCAQNIIRLVKKYENINVELACKQAVHYGNFTYKCVINILENNLFDEKDLFTLDKKSNLSDDYARNLKELLGA